MDPMNSTRPLFVTPIAWSYLVQKSASMSGIMSTQDRWVWHDLTFGTGCLSDDWRKHIPNWKYPYYFLSVLMFGNGRPYLRKCLRQRNFDDKTQLYITVPANSLEPLAHQEVQWWPSSDTRYVWNAIAIWSNVRNEMLRIIMILVSCQNHTQRTAYWLPTDHGILLRSE